MSDLSSIFTTIDGLLRSHQQKLKRHYGALCALQEAVIATRAHLSHTAEDAAQHRKQQYALTRLWMRASKKMAPVDRALSKACMLQAYGWVESWQKRDFMSTHPEVNTSLNHLLERVVRLREQAPPPQMLHHWWNRAQCWTRLFIVFSKKYDPKSENTHALKRTAVIIALPHCQSTPAR